MIKTNKRGHYLKCTRKTCLYAWEYKGFNNFCIACPHCGTTLYLKRSLIDKHVYNRTIKAYEELRDRFTKKINITENGGLPLTCPGEKCHRRWVYKGTNLFKTACSRCKRGVVIIKNNNDKSKYENWVKIRNELVQSIKKKHNIEDYVFYV